MIKVAILKSRNLSSLNHPFYKVQQLADSYDLLMQLNHCDTTLCKPFAPPPWQCCDPSLVHIITHKRNAKTLAAQGTREEERGVRATGAPSPVLS